MSKPQITELTISRTYGADESRAVEALVALMLYGLRRRAARQQEQADGARPVEAEAASLGGTPS